MKKGMEMQGRNEKRNRNALWKSTAANDIPLEGLARQGYIIQHDIPKVVGVLVCPFVSTFSLL